MNVTHFKPSPKGRRDFESEDQGLTFLSLLSCSNDERLVSVGEQGTIAGIGELEIGQREAMRRRKLPKDSSILQAGDQFFISIARERHVAKGVQRNAVLDDSIKTPSTRARFANPMLACTLK